MESDRVLSQQLTEAERASAAPWLHYPPLPWWYEPAAGAWFAAMLLVFSRSGDHWLVVPAIVALLGIEAGFFAWYRRRWGTWPQLRSAPREFRPAMRGYAAGLTVATATVVATYLAVGPWPAAGVTFVAVTVLLLWYDRRYEAASRAARTRLS